MKLCTFVLSIRMIKTWDSAAEVQPDMSDVTCIRRPRIWSSIELTNRQLGRAGHDVYAVQSEHFGAFRKHAKNNTPRQRQSKNLFQYTLKMSRLSRIFLFFSYLYDRNLLLGSHLKNKDLPEDNPKPFHPYISIASRCTPNCEKSDKKANKKMTLGCNH